VRDSLGPVFTTAITVTMNERKRFSTKNKSVKIRSYTTLRWAPPNAGTWAKHSVHLYSFMEHGALVSLVCKFEQNRPELVDLIFSSLETERHTSSEYG